jgi:hypothetical protein
LAITVDALRYFKCDGRHIRVNKKRFLFSLFLSGSPLAPGR